MPIYLSILSYILLGAVQLYAYSSGPPNGLHGQSLNCTSCHSGSVINTSSMVSISGLPGNYQPNTSYPLTLSLSGSNSRGFGFQLAVRSGNSNVGSLSTSQSGVRVDNGYLEHSTRINSPISFNWTSPASSSGTVSFWVSSLATGGSSGTSGDQTYVYNQNLQESVSAYTLSLNASSGGSVSGAGTFNHGTAPTIVATPDTGYNFTGWTGDGVANSGAASTTVSMTQVRSLTANFSLKSYTLSLNAGSGGSVSGAGSFNHGTTPTIVATPNTGYDFTGWSGLGVSSSSSASTIVSMTQARSLTANFSLKSYTLSLSAGSGGSASGAGSFNHGTTPTIVATPNTGYDFTGWSGQGISNSTSASTTVSMTQARSLTANFSLKSYTLSLTASSGGSVSGAGSFNHGTTPTIVATPNTGYDFTGWSGQGVSSSNSASTTVSMTQARSLTANFSLKSYTLSLTASSGGSVSGAGSFNHGTTPTIVATPNTGYDFTGWSGQGVSSSSSASTTVSMTQARSLTANFSLKSYTLSLTAGSGGTASGAGSFNHGTTPTIVATPNTGYDFTGWSGQGVSSSSSPSTTVPMTQARSLTANFSLKSYTLSLTAGSGGSVSGAGNYSHGQQATIQATAQSGFVFNSWLQSGVSVDTNPSTTILMNEDKNWTALFTVQPSNTLLLSLSSNPASAGTTTGAGSYSQNVLASITATPNVGYQFTGWIGSGVASQNANSTTINMNQDRNLTAQFSLKSYTLNLTSGVGGSVSGAGSFNHGTNPPIVATPSTGYNFTGWYGSGVTNSNSNSTTVNMNQDRNLTAQFSLKSYTLNLTAGAGGSVSGAGTFNHDSNTTIVATPNNGYNFSGWTGSGITYSNSNATTVNMNQDRNLTAQFTLKSYTLNITSGAGGSVSGAGTFNHDSNTTIVATPNNGYNFSGWTGSGITNPSAKSTKVFMNQDRNLTATFSLPIFKLTLETSGGGVVTGGGNFPYGTSVSYNATADDGYVFKNWMIADQNYSGQNSGSIDISSDLTLTAHFEKSLDPALAAAQSLGNNIFSSWLGYFLTFDNGWYYHLKLGWIYPQGNSTDGLWFWSQEAGWFWTNEEIFEQSFLWSKSDNDWVFLREGSTVGDTLLFSYKDGGSWNFLPTDLLSE